MLHPSVIPAVAYLGACNSGPPGMSEQIIDDACSQFRAALHRRFNEAKKPFGLRMSNIGKPLCQLQLEIEGTPNEGRPASFQMQMLIGDAVDITVLAILRASCKVDSFQQPVSLTLPVLGKPVTINGTYDVIVDGRLWDIKSASPYSYQHKFNGSFADFRAQDAFGYVGQLYGYAKAAKVPPGGWIVINKSDGSMKTYEVPL